MKRELQSALICCLLSGCNGNGTQSTTPPSPSPPPSMSLSSSTPANGTTAVDRQTVDIRLDFTAAIDASTILGSVSLTAGTGLPNTAAIANGSSVIVRSQNQLIPKTLYTVTRHNVDTHLFLDIHAANLGSIRCVSSLE